MNDQHRNNSLSATLPNLFEPNHKTRQYNIIHQRYPHILLRGTHQIFIRKALEFLYTHTQEIKSARTLKVLRNRIQKYIRNQNISLS